jgi:hypothetical protein
MARIWSINTLGRATLASRLFTQSELNVILIDLNNLRICRELTL